MRPVLPGGVFKTTREVVHQLLPNLRGAEGHPNHRERDQEGLEEVPLGDGQNKEDHVHQEPQLQHVLGQHGGGIQPEGYLQGREGTQSKCSLQFEAKNLFKFKEELKNQTLIYLLIM